MLIFQLVWTHSAPNVPLLQQLASFRRSMLSSLACDTVFLYKPFIYGDCFGHFDQPAALKLDHQFAF